MGEQGASSEEQNRSKILIVEDDEHLLHMLATIFEAEDFEVWRAANGRDAWWMLQQGRPDVVICDLGMPFMEGSELLEKVRAEEEMQDLPFMMITASGDAQKAMDSFDQGADDYMVKPLDQGELLARVRRFLRHKKKEALLEGDLSQLVLVDLLQLLQQNKRSGILEVKRGRESFTMVFVEGEMRYALSMPARVTGAKALFRALFEDRGSFRFRPKPAASLPEEQEKSLEGFGFLLMDAFRLRDEIGRLLESLPGQLSPLELFPGKPLLLQKLEGAEASPDNPLEAKILDALKEFGLWYEFSSVLNYLREEPDLDILESAAALGKRKQIRWSAAAESGPPKQYKTSGEREQVGLVSPVQLLGSPVYKLLLEGLLACDLNACITAIDQAVQEGLPPKLLYRKILVGVMKEILRRRERQRLQLNLLMFQDVVEKVLERMMPLFGGKPPVSECVAIGFPLGEIGSLQSLHMVNAFVRCLGFNVINLGASVPISSFLDAVISSGSSLLCLMINSAQGTAVIPQLRKHLDEKGFHRVSLLVAGRHFAQGEENEALRLGANGAASDALHVASRLLDLMEPSIG